MKIKRNYKMVWWFFPAILCLVALLWFLFAKSEPPLVYWLDFSKACDYIHEVDAQKINLGEYPSSEVFVRDKADFERRFFYKKQDTDYRLGFSVGFDEYYYFDSSRRTWFSMSGKQIQYKCKD